MPVLSRAYLLAAAIAPFLAGCGSNEAQDTFAPACPRPSILRDAGDLQRYRGPGRDLTDSVLTGRITNISGSCTRDGSTTVAATVTVGLELTRGPASRSRTADVAYFVAVSRGEQVLDKQVYNIRVEFPENTDRTRLTGDNVDLRLPVRSGQGAGDYQITVGFQLTQAELATNRARIGRR